MRDEPVFGFLPGVQVGVAARSKGVIADFRCLVVLREELVGDRAREEPVEFWECRTSTISSCLLWKMMVGGKLPSPAPIVGVRNPKKSASALAFPGGFAAM